MVSGGDRHTAPTMATVVLGVGALQEAHVASDQAPAEVIRQAMTLVMDR